MNQSREIFPVFILTMIRVILILGFIPFIFLDSSLLLQDIRMLAKLFPVIFLGINIENKAIRDISAMDLPAHAMIPDRDPTLSAGYDTDATKPTEEEVLLKRMHKFLGA